MRRTDRGVSTSISVALLLALVLVLSVSLAMMATSLSNVLNDSSKASVSIDEPESNTLDIRVVSLQDESVDYIYVKVENATPSGGLDSGDVYPNGPSDTAYYLYSNGTGGVGTTVTLDMSSAEAQTVYVISVTDDSEKIIQEYEHS